ncbi:MAG: helix-turn-helix domain-containing protein [Deltaproteobacteria bacterium]|nr:helix-turn-helix domain-containing protein [Deltaproteobacteria bacterium]MBM3789258.1 helix-turn-helix domain-containing protein [Acidobacteriota bacterium]
MKTLIGVRKLAEVLGVATGTVYDWCASRRIPFIKAGRRTLFDPEEIDEWLDTRRFQEAGAEGAGKPKETKSGRRKGERR